MKIKVNDKVKVLSGKNRGKEGKVTQTFPGFGKAVVEGVNIMKKHLRTGKPGEKGQVIELAAPLSAEKLMLLCPKCGRGIRVGYRTEGGVKKRFCRACKEYID